MPKAPEGPPDYEFRYVVEYCGPLNPEIAKTLYAYGEARRPTHNVLLSGRHRPLAFCVQTATRNRAMRLHWKDRTKEFFQQWKRGADGVWCRIENPPEITAPVPRLPVIPNDREELLARATAMTVKDLRILLATGALDLHLQELIQREQASAQPRAGAVASLSARYGVVTTQIDAQ